MRPTIFPSVMGMIFCAFIAVVAPNTAIGQTIKVFSDFLQLKNVVAEMQSKVPLDRKWAVVYCECKDGKVVALPVHGSATEVDRLACEQKSRSHGGCKTEARIMNVGPSEKRLEANRRRAYQDQKVRALEQEQERLWRLQQEQSSTSQTGLDRPSSDTQWMSKEDYERYQKKELTEEEHRAYMQSRKNYMQRLKDEAMEAKYKWMRDR